MYGERSWKEYLADSVYQLYRGLNFTCSVIHLRSIHDAFCLLFLWGGGERDKKGHEKKEEAVDALFILQVIGVAQVINKSKGDEVFTTKDEEVK